jgi:hypothetical protein
MPTTPDRYFSHDGETYTTHATEAEAQAEAQKAIDWWRDEADEGWDEAVTRVCWGEIREYAEERPDNTDGEEPAYDYVLAPVVPVSPALRDILATLDANRATWGDNHTIPSMGPTDPGHDGTDGDLARGAVYLATDKPKGGWLDEWMVDLRHKLRGDVRKRLVTAAALLLAEIERLDRATPNAEAR